MFIQNKNIITRNIDVFKSDNKTTQHEQDDPLHVSKACNKLLQHKHEVLAIFHIMQ